MVIDDIEFKIDFCCYQMYEHMLAYGIKEDWEYCSYCGKTFEYISEKVERLDRILGDKNELYSV